MEYIAAVNTDAAEGLVGEIQYGGSSGSGYDVDPGLSAHQVRRVYDRVPDLDTEKDDGSGNLVPMTAQEISDRVEALQLVSLDYIAELPEGDPVRLTHQAMFCLAKHAGEGDLDDDSTFGEYLTWVASGA